MTSELKLPKITYEETHRAPQLCISKQSDKSTKELQRYIVNVFDDLNEKICENGRTMENTATILKCGIDTRTRDFTTEIEKINTDFSVKFNTLAQPLKNINNKCDAIANIQRIVNDMADTQLRQNAILDELKASVAELTKKIKNIDEQVEFVKNKLSEYDIEEIVSDTDSIED
jgi:uncharacterized coiled-coil protein SlyX